MRRRLILTAILCSMAYAKEPKAYQTGKLLQMDSVACGVDEQDAKSVAGEMLGTDSGHKKTHQLLCQEYVLQTDRVIYRIRPKDEKHPVLLPIGERAQFRLAKAKMLLRGEGRDGREHVYLVVSMTTRGDDKAEASTFRLNHLQ